MFFHWQNLNEKKGKTGSGFWHGRCWWHFDNPPTPGGVVQFCWNLWAHFCGIGFDFDDEDLTFHMAFPPIAFWLSFSSNWGLVKWLLPRKVLGPNYPDTIVVDERECGIRIHSGRLWINVWSKKNEMVTKDPWWVRGVRFNLNPFEWVHMRHEVRCAEGGLQYWKPYVGSWERHKQADGREVMEFPYHYTLKSGEVQERTATVFVERMAWRPRILRWTDLFEKGRTYIDIQFSDEVGERTGSWEGGCLGCSYDLKPYETVENCLRRMERERVFA